jgi:hypothetical protein
MKVRITTEVVVIFEVPDNDETLTEAIETSDVTNLLGDAIEAVEAVFGIGVSKWVVDTVPSVVVHEDLSYGATENRLRRL